MLRISTSAKSSRFSIYIQNYVKEKGITMKSAFYLSYSAFFFDWGEKQKQAINIFCV